MVCESINGEVVRLGDNEEVEPEEGVYKLGFRPSDHPRSSNHWIVYFDDDGKSKIHLILKSQKSIIKGERALYQGFTEGPYCDWISTFPSETDPDVYHCATSKKVSKVSVDGAQETIATLKFDPERNCKYTINHGLKIKYEPDFIITSGHLATITIIPPSEAEELQAVQKELIGDSEHAKVVSEIDGRFLLSAAMDPENKKLFTKHGIDIDELKNDLLALVK